MESTPPVKDSLPLDPAAFLERLEGSAREAGFRVERYGLAAGLPLLALTKRTPGPRPRIYLSSGIHGDEPAGPLALLELVEAGLFDRRAVWLLCPLLNPLGFLKRSRENREGIDLNRDYRDTRSEEIRAHIGWLERQPGFAVTLSVHEDWEARGYYLYEQNPLNRPSLATAVLDAASACCPVDPSSIIDGREAAGGVIRPRGDPFLRELWPESIYLRRRHTTLAYTIESPSAFPLKTRIASHRAAIQAAVSAICGTI